jgi:hypothetical protein
MPYHLHILFQIGILIPLAFFELCWWVLAVRWDYFSLFPDRYLLPITMVFGAMVAGQFYPEHGLDKVLWFFICVIAFRNDFRGRRCCGLSRHDTGLGDCAFGGKGLFTHDSVLR